MSYVARFYWMAVVAALVVTLTGCPPPVTVSVGPVAATIVVGDSFQIMATSTDPLDTSFTWSCDKPLIVSVLGGTVQGLAIGEAAVTATGSHSGKSKACTVTVAFGDDFNLDLPGDPTLVAPAMTTDVSLDRTECVLEFPGVAAVTWNHEAKLFHRLKLPDAGYTETAGKPELPFYTLYFAVPLDEKTSEPAEWAVSVEEESTKTYDNVLVYPAQEPAWLDEVPVEDGQKANIPDDWLRPPFRFDDVAYASNNPYPEFKHTADAFHMGNLDIVEVRVFPARYVAAQKRLMVSTQLRVKVEFESDNALVAPFILTDFTGIQESVNEEWIADSVANGSIITRMDATELLAPLPPRTDTILDEDFQLLILTRDELYDQAFELGQHRQDDGLRVALYSLAESTYPDWESIREAILHLDDTNRVAGKGGRRPRAMTAILLFGDAEIIPPCVGMNYRGYDDPTDPAESLSIVGTDLPYAAIRGDDDIPDVAIGRISVDTADEAAVVVAKIKQYEGHAGAPNRMAVYGYFDDVPEHYATLEGDSTFAVGNSVVIGSGTDYEFAPIHIPSFIDYIRCTEDLDDYPDWSRVVETMDDTHLRLSRGYAGPHNITGETEVGALDGIDDWEFVKTAERVRQFMLDQSIDVEFGYAMNPRGPHPTYGFEGNLLPSDLLAYDFDCTTPDIQAAWREGADAFILHSDHGYRGGWGHPGFSKTDLVALTDPVNGFYPIVFSINCSSGWFDNETDTKIWGDGVVRTDSSTGQNDESFCEAALRFPDGGAVATFGAIRGSDAGRNDKLVDGLWGSLYEDFTAGSIGGEEHPSFTRLGNAIRWAKLHQHSVLDNENYERYNLQIYHLLGDPMLRIKFPEP